MIHYHPSTLPVRSLPSTINDDGCNHHPNILSSRRVVKRPVSACLDQQSLQREECSGEDGDQKGKRTPTSSRCKLMDAKSTAVVVASLRGQARPWSVVDRWRGLVVVVACREQASEQNNEKAKEQKRRQRYA